MKVKELIALLQKHDQNAEIMIDNGYNIGFVWDCPTIGKINITTEPTEESLNEMELDNSEIIDMMKINRVR